MSYVTITQIHRPGGFTNAAGTVNFLRAIDQQLVRADWEELQIGGLNLANLEMVAPFEDTTDFLAGNWVYYACQGGTLHSGAAAGTSSVSVDGLGDSTFQPNVIPNPSFGAGAQSWSLTNGGQFSWSVDGANGGRLFVNSGSAGAHPSHTEAYNAALPASLTFASQQITVSGTINVLSLGGAGDQLYVLVYDSVLGTLGSHVLNFGVAGGGDHEFSFTATIPAFPNTVYIQCVAVTGSSGACQVVGHFRNLSIRYTNAQSDILAGDYVLITDGINTDLMQVSSVAGSSPWTVNLTTAPGQGSSSLLNSYAAGATIARLQFSGYLLARDSRTTDYSEKYTLKVQGFAARYNTVMCNADIVSQDCATSLYQLCNSYSGTLPQIIVSSGNFASANSFLCTTQAQNGKVMKVITDIIKTENAQNANVNYAFWVDRVRQAHHATLPGANTATPSGNLGDAGTTPTNPTFYIDVNVGGQYGDNLGPIDATDMDISQLVNTALVYGGQNASTKQPISIIVQDTTSQNAWGYFEGVFSNPDITDETALANWGAGQLCISAYPHTTAKASLTNASARLTCRDLLQVSGYTDATVLQFNPTRIKYTADNRQRIIVGDMDLAQARPDIGAIITAGQNQVSIRNTTIKPPTNLDKIFVVSGFDISVSGLNVTIAAGTISYNGTIYNLASYSYTLASNDAEQFGGQVSGSGTGLPKVVTMPSRIALSRMFGNNLYNVTRPATQGSALTITAQTNFIGVPLWRITSQNGVVTGKTDLRVWGGTTNNNLPVMPANATISASGVSVTVVDAGMHTLASTLSTYAGTNPVLSIAFTLGDANAIPSTQWGYQYVLGTRAHTTSTPTDATTYDPHPQNRTLPLGNGATPTLTSQVVLAGNAIDIAVWIVDSQGNRTNCVQLVSSYAMPGIKALPPVQHPIIGIGHLIGDLTGDLTTNVIDGSLKRILHTFGPTSLQGTLNSTTDAFGTYTKPGVIHRGHLDATGGVGATNLLYNPTFASGTTGWTFSFSGTAPAFTWSTDQYGGGRLLCSIPANAVSGRLEEYYAAPTQPFKGQPWCISGYIQINGSTNWSATTTAYVAIFDSTGAINSYTLSKSNGDGAFPFQFTGTDHNNGTIYLQCVVNIGATSLPNTGSSTVTFHHLQAEYGSRPSPFVDHLAAAVTNTNFDSSANARSSTMLASKVPNSIAWTSNISIGYSSSGVSPSITMKFWYDNGSGADATIYNPDQTTVNVGHTTSSSGYATLTGVTSGAPVYILMYYNKANSTMTLTPSLSAPALTSINTAYGDGGYSAIIATTQASSQITGGGSGTSSAAGRTGSNRY